jgi:hypothetical protein
VYDIAKQRLLSQDEFRDPRAAAKADGDLELRHRGDENVEIVLVGADSIETIMKTHGHYFGASTGPDRSPDHKEVG